MDGTTIAFIIFVIILFIGFIVEQVSILAAAGTRVIKNTIDLPRRVVPTVLSPFANLGESIATNKKTAYIYAGVMLAIFIIVIFTGSYGNGKQAFEVLLY